MEETEANSIATSERCNNVDDLQDHIRAGIEETKNLIQKLSQEKYEITEKVKERAVRATYRFSSFS